MENKIQDLDERNLAFLSDKEVINKLMKNDFINGHRPAQMYQNHHLQTIPKLNSEANMKIIYSCVDKVVSSCKDAVIKRKL